MLKNKNLTMALAMATLLTAAPSFSHGAGNDGPAPISASDPLLGIWKTERKEDENRTADVEIAPCQDSRYRICGKIVGLEEPIDPDTGKPKLDKHNPDESLRSRPVMGQYMLTNFRMNDDGDYVDGEIYSARTGKTYRAKLFLNDKGELEVTGYVFIFSKTQVWTRVK